MPGFFFSLEGIDGVGKTTQTHLLVTWLRQRGWQVTTCRDPGGTPAGDRIRRILLDPELPISPIAEMLLFQASRALLAEQVIRPAWSRGEIVVSDRFLLSTVVYQGYGGGLNPEEIWRLGERVTGGLLPLKTWVLDMPAEQAVQ
jgi:dTMP kinase